MSKKSILIYIIFMLLIIIILILALLSNMNLSNTNQNLNNNKNNLINNNLKNNLNISNVIQGEPSNEISHDDKVVLDVTPDYFDVKINSVYFAIEDIANSFFDNIDKKNTEKIYNVLGKDYINKSGITKENVNSVFAKYVNSSFKVEKIKEKIIENNICIFIVYGTINEKDTYNIAVITDEDNLNYLIYPYEYLITNDINSLRISSISANQYNKLVYKDVNQETLAKHHFEDFKYYAINNPEKLYEKLDSEYSLKRFGSLEKFKEYINSNKTRIENSSLKSYKVIKDGNVKQYNCIDNHGNKYIFRETVIMQYEVMLDNYTIMIEEDLEYYNDLDNDDKAKYNLTKFINMVNTKDYTAIYNVLNSAFKNNNFKTENDLKKYIEKNMYNLNSLELEDFDDLEGYYAFECKIINTLNNAQKKNMTVVISKTEDTNFTMSFSFE